MQLARGQLHALAQDALGQFLLARHAQVLLARARTPSPPPRRHRPPAAGWPCPPAASSATGAAPAPPRPPPAVRPDRPDGCCRPPCWPPPCPRSSWPSRRSAAPAPAPAAAARSASAGSRRAVNGRNTCRTVAMVAGSWPISRLPRSVTMDSPPGTWIGLLIAPGGISCSTRSTAGIDLVGLHPALVAALQRGLALAELRRHHRERRAGTQLLDDRVGEAPRLVGLRRIGDRHEDLGDAELLLAGLRLAAGRPAPAMSASLTSVCGPSTWRSTRLQPICTRTWSISVRNSTPSADSRRRSVPSRHAVALLDLADRGGDLAVLHDHVPPLHFLQPQPLVDQLPGHLRRQPVQHLGRRPACRWTARTAGAGCPHRPG